MKKILGFAVLLIASVVFAGTYSVTTNAKQDERMEKERTRINKAECKAAQLPNSCTQAQCRAVNPNCNIFSDVADLIDRKVVKDYADGLKQKDTADDQVQFCEYWTTATVAQRNATCATAGLPNGCELCQ